MVVSIQMVKNRTTNLNRIGFSSRQENLSFGQPQILLEQPKQDEFVRERNKNNAVRNGAITGAVVEAGIDGAQLYKNNGLDGMAKALSKKLDQHISTESMGFIILGAIIIYAGIGAAIGSIFKHLGKKDKAA